MRPLIFILSTIAIMGLAFWAYRENYQTQSAIREVRTLHDEIKDLREALVLQRAEWAFLNRPDRLRDLALLNYDRLGLLPLEPEQFGAIADIAMPPVLPPDLLNATDVMGELPEDPL